MFRKISFRSQTIFRITALVILLLAVVALQFEYDMVRLGVTEKFPSIFSPAMIRMADMGFHSTVASFLWISTMPKILRLVFTGNPEYFSDLALLNAVDPKMSYPYAFSVLTLPIVPTSTYGNIIVETTEIGERGLRNADPDWRIPYYMAINYYLELKDFKRAAEYFNLAAETSGMPDFARRFALNFGINQRDRDRVRGIWETIYKSTNDPATKARAEAYVQRLTAFDYLEAAARAFKLKYGSFPSSTSELVEKGIIPAIPEDPLGFTFVIYSDGTAGIDKTK